MKKSTLAFVASGVLSVCAIVLFFVGTNRLYATIPLCLGVVMLSLGIAQNKNDGNDKKDQ